MKNRALYPAAPKGVPDDLTRPSGAYRFRVLVLAGSLTLFFLMYLAMVVGTAYLTYKCATYTSTPSAYSRNDRRGSAFIILAGTFFFGMLFLFLLKGLFKGRRADRSSHVELKRAKHPQLFEFIDRLCDEVGAPRPAGVYASPDVNAAVIYNLSLLNLIIPPRKYLLIGFGLVNSINLREFKAVLAHEFGHFSQGSLALGRYVYVMNQIIRDIVHARDFWDDLINWWCGLDLRLSFPAWGLKGLVWAMRGLLDRVFRAVTLMDLALSRQMEFNADDAAVSVAGSDAIVNVLCRLDFAGEALARAAHDLNFAADHEIFTSDLFFHQTEAAQWLRKQRKDPRLGLPPEEPEDPDAPPIRVFDPARAARGDEGIPAMWRTHPPNHEREQNAKRHYLRAPADERSPWLLFDAAAEVKKAVTRRFYAHGMERKERYRPTDPEEVQKFIDAEHAETTYDPKYHGFYDDRFVDPGDVNDLVTECNASPWPAEKVSAFLQSWPNEGLEQRVKDHADKQGEAHLLYGLKSGEYTLKGKTFTFREVEHSKRDVKWLLEMVEKELEESTEAFKSTEKEVFQAHFQAAKQIDDNMADELHERYRFHLATQHLLRKLINDEQRMNAILQFISGKQQLQTGEFQEVVETFQVISRSLADCMYDAKNLYTPALTNVEPGTALRKLVWERDADIPRIDASVTQISSEWIVDFMKKQNAAQTRLRRIHFKSLGNILMLQERIAQAYLASAAQEVVNLPEN